MVCRRRWRIWVVMMAGAMAALGAAAPTALPTADDFETAAAKELPGKRNDIFKAMPATPAVDRDAYAAKVARDFTRADRGINSARSEVRLNSAILLHDLQTLSTDRALMLMVQSKDAAVRYWGAKGLGDMSVKLMSVGKAPAVAALRNAGKTETSGVVVQEIITALDRYGDLPAMVDVLTAISGTMQTANPDLSLLQSVAQGLDSVAKGVPAAPGDKTSAANAAARLASFAAQQLMNNDRAIKAIDKTATVPPENLAAVKKVVDAAVKVINAAAGKNYFAPPPQDPGELLMNVNTIFGTPPPGSKAGLLQADLKAVTVPPAVKAGP